MIDQQQAQPAVAVASGHRSGIVGRGIGEYVGGRPVIVAMAMALLAGRLLLKRRPHRPGAGAGGRGRAPGH